MFWSNKEEVFIGSDLRKLSEVYSEKRKSIVEKQFESVKTEVITLLKNCASTTFKKSITIRLSKLFNNDDGATPLGKKMKELLGFDYLPTSEELVWYGRKLEDYFMTQKLEAIFMESECSLNLHKLKFNWTFDPTKVEKGVESFDDGKEKVEKIELIEEKEVIIV